VGNGPWVGVVGRLWGGGVGWPGYLECRLCFSTVDGALGDP
jgi:hypothetical protein